MTLFFLDFMLCLLVTNLKLGKMKKSLQDFESKTDVQLPLWFPQSLRLQLMLNQQLAVSWSTCNCVSHQLLTSLPG